MDSIIETSEVKADRATALLDSLDAETKGLLLNFRGTGDRGGLTEKDYHKVIDLLLEKTGKVPTQYVISKATGGTSFTTIGPALRTWKASYESKAHPVEEKQIAPIPEALAHVTNALITSAVQEIGTKIWEASETAHSKAIEAERQVMKGELAKAEQAIVEANQATEEVADELAQSAAKHEAKHAETAALLAAEQKRAEDLGKLVNALKTDYDRERGRAQEIERERDSERTENARLASALSHTEAEIERLKALLQGAEQRVSEATANAAQMREEADKRLADLRETLTRERSKSAADLQAAEQRERKAAAEIESLKKEKHDFKQALDAGQARIERNTAEAKAELKDALAQQALTFEDRIKAAKSEAAAAQKTVAALSEQVEMLKKQTAEKPKGDKKQPESAQKPQQKPETPAAEAGAQNG
jgi:DNA repair exonuclease SbcCD ATPase subunit